MNEETRMLLASLSDEERNAITMLRNTQDRRKQVLLEQKEFEELQAKLVHEAYLAELAKVPQELSVLGVSYRKLRGDSVGHNSLRLVHVHRDVRNLLVAALPSKDEKQWCQLISALALRLVGMRKEVRGVVSELKVSSDTKHYFNPGEAVSIPIAAVGIVLGAPSEMLSDMVTTWALEWGKATNYEGNAVA